MRNRGGEPSGKLKLKLVDVIVPRDRNKFIEELRKEQKRQLENKP